MRKLLSLFTALLFVGTMWGGLTTVFTETFEDDAFVTSTTYNNKDEAMHGPTNYQWGVICGTPVSTSHGGSKAFAMRYYKSVNKTPITTQYFNVSEVDSIKFWAKTENTGNKLKVEYSTNSGSSWETLANSITLTTSFAEYKYGFDSQKSTVRLRFSLIGTSNEKKSIIIDDIAFIKIVPDIPTVAVKPTSLDFGTVDQYSEVTAKSFKLKGANLTAGMKLTAPAGYTILPDTLTETQAMNEDSVTITVTPVTTSAGDKGGNLTITSSKTPSAEFSVVNVALTMSVTARYAIETSGSGGDITWEASASGNNSPAYIRAGETVMATATADGNHDFGSLSLSENVTVKEIDGNVASFTMPASAVTITAVFNEKQDPSISVSEETLNWGRVKKGEELLAKTITIAGARLTEALTLTWDKVQTAFDCEVTAGSLTPTAGVVNATVTITPNTENVDDFAHALTIGGGGLADKDKKEVDIYMNVLQTYTAEWYINGSKKAYRTDTAGVSISANIPDATTAKNGAIYGKVFKGWAEAAIDGEVAEGSAGIVTTPTVMPAADKTYYAVYATETPGAKSLTKMVKGNTLSDGDMLVIVANGTDTALYQETVSTSYVNVWKCTTLNTTTVSANDKNWVTVTATTGGFWLGDDTNGYINMSGNNLYCNETKSVWTLSDLGDGTFKLQSNERNLSYRRDLSYKYWRMGGASGGNSGVTILDLYKYAVADPTYSAFATNGPRLLELPEFTPEESETIYNTAIEIEISATEGTIYYTLDGTDPTALSTEYTGAITLDSYGTHTIKAIAINGDNKSNIASASYTLNVPFKSLEELVAARLATNTAVTVSFSKVKITALDTSTGKGVYVNVKDKDGENDIEIYANAAYGEWVVNGTISGSNLTGTWKQFSGIWEVSLTNGWTGVSYAAPDPTGFDNTDAEVKAVKTIVNGQLFIEKNGHIYNAMGQLVK